MYRLFPDTTSFFYENFYENFLQMYDDVVQEEQILFRKYFYTKIFFLQNSQNWRIIWSISFYNAVLYSQNF